MIALKQHNKSKSERGAVALISIFIMTTLILVTAMAVDYSMFFYKGTKLQNAVDSAATAVAAELDATTYAQEQIARQYLTKNGFDGDSSDIEVKIEHKGVLDEASYYSDVEYISTGYIKLTVDTNQGMIFSEILNKDSMRLIKTAYVKCDAVYDGNPQALDYTLFAGTTKGTPASSALRINGRTGNVENYLASQLERFINGINEAIVQPIIGIFGGNSDFTDLVHINLSEAITDGDVHSNSDISIGVQVVNASRTKDGNLQTVKTDADGNPIQAIDEYGNPIYETKTIVKTDSNGDPIKKTDPITGETVTDAEGNIVFETETITEPKYIYEYDNSAYNNNKPNDYGQVTYTAVKEITFTNTSLDASTHVYTQNQQHLELTQAALNIINNIDLNTVSSIGVLQNAYTEAANVYINAYAQYIDDNQKQNILNQKNNLAFDPATKTVTLNNQNMIVYDVSQKEARQMLDMVVNADGEVSLDDLYSELSRNKLDDVYAADGTTLLFQGTADKRGTINYSVVVNGGNVNINGVQASRDFAKTNLKLFNGDGSANTTNKTVTGAKLSVVDTFQQLLGDDGYIPTPNLKPYFVREVNKSIRNATKTKEDLGDSEAKGDRTVKEAVRHLGDRLAELLNNSDYTDDKYETYTERQTNDGTKYEASGELKSNSVESFLKDYQQAENLGLTSLTGTDRTNFMGIKLIKQLASGETALVSPSEVISNTPYYQTSTAQRIAQFKASNIERDSDHANASVTDYANHYGKEAVDKKRQSLVNTVSYGSVASRFGQFNSAAPAVNNVFLTSSGTPFNNMNAGINATRALAESGGGSSSGSGSTTIVSRPDVTAVTDIAAPSAPVVNNRTVTIDGRNYNVYNIVTNTAGSTPMDVINQIKNDHTWGNKDLTRSGNIHYTNDTYTHNYNGNKSYTGERGLNVKAGQYLLEDGYAKVGKNSNGYKEGCTVNSNGYLLLGGNPLYQNSSTYTTALDAGQSHGLKVDTNGVLIANGNAWVLKLELGTNSVVIINGEFYVSGGGVTVPDGATLIVTGDLVANGGKISVGNNSKLYVGGKITYAKGSGNGKLTQGSGSTVVILNSNGTGLTELNYDTTVPAGAILYIKGTTKVYDSSVGLKVEGGTLYTENLTYYSDRGYLKVSVLDTTYNSQQYYASFYNASSMTVSSFSATGSNVVRCGNVTVKNSSNALGDFSANKAYIVGNMTEVNAVSGGTIHCTGNLTANSIGSFNNLIVDATLTVNGDYTIPNTPMKVGNFVSTGAVTNNSTKLTITGSYRSATLQNNGYLVTGTSLTTTGNLTNGAADNHNATLYALGQIYVGGNLVNYGKIGCLAGDGSGYAIDVAGKTTNADGSIIYTSVGSLRTQDLTTSESSEVNIAGNLVVTRLAVNNTNMVIEGDSTMRSLQNEAAIYCTGNLTVEYLKVTKTGSFACNGNLTITSSIDGISLYVEGKCYVRGGINAAGTVYVDKGILYAYGDICAANSTSNGGNILWMENHSQVYVNGGLKSDTNDMHIWIQGDTYNGDYDGAPTNTVLSVYGDYAALNNSYFALKKDASVLCNQQSGSSVYLGTGSSSNSSIVDKTISFNGGGTAVESAGSLYVYGNLASVGATTVRLSGNGKTYIKGSLTALLADLTITGGPTAGVDQHEFTVWDIASVKSVSINNTKFYVLKSLTATSSNIAINNGSMFYVGTGSTFDLSGPGVSINTSTVYLPKVTGTLNYNTSANGCGIVTDSDVKFTANTTIPQGLTIYIGGKTTFENDIEIVNNGNLYMMGDVDLRGLKKYSEEKTTGLSSRTYNKLAGLRFGDNSDTFIGKATSRNYQNTLTYNNMVYYAAEYVGRGNVYIDNDLCSGEVMEFYEDKKDDDKNRADFVGNRRAGLAVKSGKTYVSGNVTVYDNTGTLIADNATLSCGGNFMMGSTIYNNGSLIAFGNLIQSSTASKPTDRAAGKEMKEGNSIKNGENEGDTSDLMFFGGTAGTNLKGYVVNFGQLYQNGALLVQGYTPYGGMERSTDCAFVNRIGAQAYINGDANMNSNCLFNDENAKFHCQGTLDFGPAIANCNELVVNGNIVQNQNSVNGHKYRIDTFTMSIMNGLRKAHGTEYKNAVLYCGGTINLGQDETAGYAGSVFNCGAIYAGGDFNINTNSGNSFFVTGLWSLEQSKVIVGGDFFVGAGAAMGNDTIFMCGGDYRAKRALKVNVVFGQTGDWQYTFYDRDDYKRAYFYVGQNMMVNTLGKRLWRATNTIPQDMSRAMVVRANTDMFVGGSFFANSDVKLGDNCNLVVAGAGNRLNRTATINEILTGMEDLNYVIHKARIRDLLSNNDYGFVAYQGLDVRPCSSIIVNGGAFVRDTAKIRDMTKTYFYGNFDCTDYVEIGKALDGVDETEAKEDRYKAAGENNTDYNFSNAGYMFVGGDFVGQKYLKVYASTTMRVTGDCTLQTKYVTLRHDANLYVGKKLKALTSIDVGSYAKVIVGGSMQASTSTIKIRDNVTCFVGGNMTALSYIELGKFGDYTRHIINMASMSSFPNPNASNTTYKPGYLYHDNSTGKYYYWSQLNNRWQESDYSGLAGGITEGGTVAECTCCDDCFNGPGCSCSCKDSDCKWHGTNTSTDAGNDTSVEEGNDTQESFGNTTTVETNAELAADDSDFAHGATFYIGKTLASYTGYIKEFAYSQVSVGNYVFTPKYITLRHNSDMWVMPETFNNSTYIKKSYVPKSDGTFWGDLKDRIGEFAFNVKETFTPKNGSVYTLGELTLNKNASLMGTWDCSIQGKCVLRPDSLVYMGHDFNLTAPSLNLSMDAIRGKESVCGFDTYGTSTGNTSFPVVVYADNEINIMTTIDMKLTYLVANRGDVKLYDIYSRSENAERNAKSLPNAICSYSKGIDYFAMYGKIGALFYCPNGHLDLDAYYLELWGSGIGDTVKVNTYYFAMHRFTNWSTMDLQLASSGKVRLISQSEYDEQTDNVDDIFMFDDANSSNTSDSDFVRQGASLFFNFDGDGNPITRTPVPAA